MYSFRIRINRSPTDSIDEPSTSLELPGPDSAVQYVLRSKADNVPIKNSDRWAFIANGFPDEEAAKKGAQGYHDALVVALGRVRVGADFGERASKSLWYPAGLEMLQQQFGVPRVLNNTHGMMVYETDLAPKFVSSDTDVLRSSAASSFIDALKQAIELDVRLSDRQRIAYSVFNASFFVGRPDPRFLLLVMAVEALVELQARDRATRDHVEAMMQATAVANISEADRRSILGSLEWLRNESIGQGCRREIDRLLRERQYGGKLARKFFSECYELRSRMVHGHVPAPSLDEVSTAAGTLEVLVSDLLTAAAGLPLPLQ